jgi:8-amino-7-oxononanoate synthase
VTAWADWTERQLDGIRVAGRWRRPRDLDADGPRASLDGRPIVTFASNDYLGLTRHPAVMAAAHDAIDRWGTGAGSARLITGSRPVHTQLEAELADWKGTDGAVLFTTGYAANLGVLSTFGGPGTTILSDELNHASIIDGARHARSRVLVYRHADLGHLADLLDGLDRSDPEHRVLVVTDSVFSMDGDVADLAGLVELCRRHGALLVIDEAHAVLGPDLPDLPAIPGDDDHGGSGGGPVPVLRVGTLSKALGSLGGFVAGPTAMVDLLRNRARTFIFTTASTPADTAAARAALAVVRSAEGARLRATLRSHIDRLRPGHPSPIVAVVLGSEERAVDAAASLLDAGLFVPAIRPPTVAPGTSRLRITLSAAHTSNQVDRLVDALGGLDVDTVGATTHAS